jgi:hypothetical protein
MILIRVSLTWGVTKPPSDVTGCPGPSQAEERGGKGWQVVKSCLSVTIIKKENDGVDYSRV